MKKVAKSDMGFAYFLSGPEGFSQNRMLQRKIIGFFKGNIR